jgi:hypothetical protein
LPASKIRAFSGNIPAAAGMLLATATSIADHIAMVVTPGTLADERAPSRNA